MATRNILVNGTAYTLVSSAPSFIAENTSNGKMLGVFSDSLPLTDDDARVIHPREQVERKFSEPEGNFYVKMAHPEGKAEITIDEVFDEKLGSQAEINLEDRKLRAQEDTARTLSLLLHEVALLNKRFEEAFDTNIEGIDL